MNADLPVLVVVVTNAADWQRVVAEHWYRIPIKHAPPAVAASFLAFYHTQRASSTPFAITWYAPVLRYRQATRRDLLPDQPDHPRAAEQYYVIDLGPLVALPQPIPSRKLRRLTFIPTTFGRLMRAQEINDLWLGDAAEDIVWAWFQDAGIKAERRLEINEGQHHYVADVAVLAGARGLAIFFDQAPNAGKDRHWEWLVLQRATLSTSTDWQYAIRTLLDTISATSCEAVDQTLHGLGGDQPNSS